MLVSDMIFDAQQQFGQSIFREVVILACWCIWLRRNSIVFDCGSLARRRSLVKEELARVSFGAKSSLKLELESWLCNFNFKIFY